MHDSEPFKAIDPYVNSEEGKGVIADFLPIETAPKDGTLVQGMIDGRGISFFRCFWKDDGWVTMSFKAPCSPTHWRHDNPERRTKAEQA